MNNILFRTAAAVTMAVGLVACTTTPSLEAVTDFDPAFKFSEVRTIAIAPVERMNAAAVLVSDMEVNRMNQIFIDELATKGLEVIEHGSKADMHMTWHLVTEEVTDVRSYNSVSYYNCWRCGPAVSDITVRQHTRGTLIVDLIDPGKAQSVWRSTVQSKLKSKPDFEDKAGLRQEAARALFANFPPAQAQ